MKAFGEIKNEVKENNKIHHLSPKYKGKPSLDKLKSDIVFEKDIKKANEGLKFASENYKEYYELSQKIHNDYKSRFFDSNGKVNSVNSDTEWLDAIKSDYERANTLANQIYDMTSDYKKYYSDEMNNIFSSIKDDRKSIEQIFNSANEYDESDFRAFLKEQENLNAEAERLFGFDLKSAWGEINEIDLEISKLKKEKSETGTIASYDENGNATTKYVHPMKNYGAMIKKLEEKKFKIKADINIALNLQNNYDSKDKTGSLLQMYEDAGAELVSPEVYGDLARLYLMYDIKNGSSVKSLLFGSENMQKVDTYSQLGRDFKYLTDDEIAFYRRTAGGEKYGFYDKGSTEKTAIQMAQISNQREAEEMVEILNGNTLKEIGHQFEASFDGLLRALSPNRAIDGEVYRPYEISSSMVSENLEKKGFVANVAGRGASFAGRNLPIMGLAALAAACAGSPQAGTAVASYLMAITSASDSYVEAKRLGHTDDEAMKYAVMVGVSEGLLSATLDGVGSYSGASKAIVGYVKGIKNAGLKLTAEYGAKALSEVLEETLQDALNPFFKNIAFNETDNKIDWEELGYTALLSAFNATATNIAFSGVSSVFSGVGDNIATNQELTAIGKELANSGDINTVLDAVNELKSNKQNDKLKKLAESIYAKNKTTELSNKGYVNQFGNVENTVNFLNKDYRDIGKIYDAVLKSNADKVTNAQKTAFSQMANQVISKMAEDKQKIADITVDKAVAVLKKANNNKKLSRAEQLIYDNIGGDELINEIVNSTEYEAAVYAALDTHTSEGNKIAEDRQQISDGGNTNFDVSPEGYGAINKKTDEEINIAEILSIKNGKMILKLDNGEAIAASDVSFANENDAVLYSAVLDMDINAVAANGIVKRFAGSGLSAERYAMGMSEAYRYGFYGIPANQMSGDSLGGKLNVADRMYAYELGRAIADEKTKQAQTAVKVAKKTNVKKEKGEVIFEQGKPKNLTDRQKTSIKVLNTLAKVLEKDIYIFESGTDSKGEHTGVNGEYITKEGKIRIDLHSGVDGSGVMLFTAAHELTHFIKEYSPKMFKNLSDFLMSEYGKKGVNVDDLVKARMEKSNLDYDTAFEEVVASSMEILLTDTNAAEKIARLKAKDAGLVAKIKEFFDNLLNKIKQAYSGIKPDTVESRYVADMVDSLETLSDIFARALDDASENFKRASVDGTVGKNGLPRGKATLGDKSGDGNKKASTESGEVKRSEREQKTSNDEHFLKQLNDWRDGLGKAHNTYNGEYFELGETPINLVNNGAKSLPLIMYESCLVKITGGKHSISLENLSKLPSELSDPVLLFKGSIPNSYVALTELTMKNGHDVIAVIHLNKNHNRYKINKIASVYSKTSEYEKNKIVNYVMENINKGNLIDASIKKASKWFTSRGLQLPKLVQTIIDANNSIPNKTDNVKKFSERKQVISEAELKAIQSIGRKNVNDFTTADIKKTEQFARRYFEEMGVKSPLFKAWFGDWRAYDKQNQNIATNISNIIKINNKSRNVKNGDTGWGIQITKNLMDDTLHYANKDKIYLQRLLGEIDTIVERAVLLGSSISEKNNNNKKGTTVFMHYLYSVVEYNGNPFLAKIAVEEYGLEGAKRAYNLQRIKMSALSRAQYLEMKSAYRDVYASNADGISIADLFGLVKQYDKKFVSKSVNPVLLNIDGTPKVFYHGTNESFTEFKPEEMAQREGSYFFAENREDAAAYGKKILEVYLTGENLADYDNQPSEFYRLKDKRAQVEWLKERGYDGWYADMDSEGWGEVSVFESTQIKSATDNIGTFDGNNPDIRFSERLQEEELKAQREANRYLEKENSKLREDIENLKQMLQLQRQITHGEMFTKSSLDVVAKRLMGFASARGNRTELVGLVENLYKHIAAGEDVSYESIREMSAPVMEWLQKNTVRPAERSEYATEVLKEIKSYKLSFSDLQKAEAAFGFDGDFNKYRKQNFGRFTVSENGLPLDIAWQELSDMYPELFDADITATDQPIKLMEIVDNLQNENINDFDIWQDDFFKQSLFEKIYDEYWNVSTLRTFADRKQKEINILKSNHRKAVENIRRARDEKINDLKHEQRERVGRLREEYRAREQKKVKDVAERYRQSRKAVVESRTKTEEKNRLRKTIAEINSLLNHGSKEKNVKIAMQDVASSALKLGTVLFNKEISNRDIVNFFMMEQFAVTVKEKAALERYSDLLEKRKLYQSRIDDLMKLTHNEVRAKTIDEQRKMIAWVDRKLSVLDKELKDVFVRERSILNNTKVTDAVDELLKAYTALQKSEQPHIAGAYNAFVAGRIKAIAGLDNGVSEYAGMVVGDMSVLQLRELGDAYRSVLHTIKTSNELFKSNKSKTVQELSELTLNEITGMAKKGIKAERNQAEKFSSKYLFNSLKPYYAFSKIGSETLMHLYKELQKGESVVGTDLAEAENFINDARKSSNFYKWDLRKRHKFTITEMFAVNLENTQENASKTKDGFERRAKDIDLTLPQIMSIYAYSKREQAAQHILEGGFVFNANETVRGEKGVWEYTKNQAEPFRPSPESIVDIINTLTDEQKAYVDEMQDYLSDVMGAKGNEVSRTLFDIDLFKEKFYFPLKSSNEYLKIKNTPVTARSLINSGMTKEIIPGAKNPIILSSFDDVWCDHVNKMSTYHALAVPLENFRKVFEYSINSEGSTAKSVRLAIQAVYGEAAKDYVQKFMDDLNGGVAFNSEKGLFEKGFTKMKKTAVAASLSVAIQQPTAIIRAMAEIAPKYFFGLKVDKGNYSQKWAELKKYAPIAVLKEIGGWDAGGSRGLIDYLDKGSRLSKGKKILRTIDEKSMWLAEQGDVIGWCTIWEAVKRETKAKNPNFDTKSDAFLSECGERFNDVVSKTQVYDSTFSRSGFMRSNNAFDRMATSFMGEPTTSINMLYDAALQLIRGNISKKVAARKVGTVIAASIAAEALKGFIVALGDDDEEEAYIEKYLQAVFDNPLKSMALYIPEMLPYFRDIVSVVEGYTVGRSDVQIYQDIVDAYKALGSDNKSGYRKAENFIGAIGNVFGVPVKNVMKTGRQMYNLVANIADDNYLSFKESGVAMKEAMFGEITTADVNKALESGNTEKAQEYIERLLEDCDTDEEIKKKKSSIKRSVTTYWKSEYLEAYSKNDSAKMFEIRKTLYATGLYDDVGATVQDWVKNSHNSDSDEEFWGKW